ncbi:MAG: XdhC/CoxI family protein [Eubacteriales bacterium]
MKRIFSEILMAFMNKEDVVLCSIIASSGSTPRGAGAKMAVLSTGKTVGTIGGGAVEFQATETAKEVLRTGESQTKGFILKRNEVADIGMICGGDVTVYFQYFDGKNTENMRLISDIRNLYHKKVNSWLVTSIGEGFVWDMGVYVKGQGFIGGGSLVESEVLPLCQGKAVLTKNLYVEPLTSGSAVYVFGGGHVSQELVPVISHLDFRTIVYENRPEFANKRLFPGAFDVIWGSFTDIVDNCDITEEDYIIIMTRGHSDDYDVLGQALRTQANYIGVIGSRKKVAATFARLHEDGFTQRDTERIFTPIGLEIQAETPAEIAISIAAQLISHRANRH